MITLRQVRCVAAVLCAFLLNSLAAHASETIVMGDHGDKSFHTVCPGGSFMVGIQVHSGAWVDQLTIKCATVSKDGVVGAATLREPHGGPGGGLQAGVVDTCAAGSLINAMHVSFTPNDRQVRFFNLDCRSEKDGSIKQLLKVGAPTQTSAPRDHDCQPGELAVGLNGNEGKDINAVGIICAANPHASAPSASDQQLIQKCKDYASLAVSKYNEFTARGCAIDVPNRWSNNYQGHYNWCISVGLNSPAPKTEADHRASELSQCSTTHPLPGTGNPGALNPPSQSPCVASCNTCYQQGLKCSGANANCSANAPALCFK